MCVCVVCPRPGVVFVWCSPGLGGAAAGRWGLNPKHVAIAMFGKRDVDGMSVTVDASAIEVRISGPVPFSA